ncbi:MAG: methyltransferase [Gemmatimonas sp.]|nr:methyltransferase [Gemmatimonas sp.]
MLSVRFGTPAEFAAVRNILIGAGFTSTNVSERGDVSDIYKFRTVGEGRKVGLEIRDRLDLLVRLFVDCLAVRSAQVDQFLSREDLAAIEALGLLDRHPEDPDRYASTVRLYPTAALFIASDLETQAPGRALADELEPPDHVFSAITTLTGTFLGQIPETPCDRFLEVCAGTGIAALRAASTARHAWALDITERSTRFAEFNARLNAIENFTARQGDLYDPVRGMTFDRIVAHPPYVPAPSVDMIYRDGGQDGEQISRRILAGLPEHLEPGGRFYCTWMTTDRKDAQLEQRVREMLGEQDDEFDLVAVTHQAMPPGEYYGRLAAAGRISFAQAEERYQLFRDLGAERMVYCSLALQRHTTTRRAFTIRRESAEGSGSNQTEWLLGWCTTLEETDTLAELLEARPRLSEHARLHVTHRVEGGEWKVDASEIRLQHPFVRTIELSLNSAILLTLCDGDRSIREILERVKVTGALGAEVHEQAFAEFVRVLIGEGVLVLAEPLLSVETQ